MNIAYVSDAIYPYNKGGKEKRLYDISTRMAKMGHDVHIYCMKWWKEPEKHRIEHGVHLHAISPYYPLYSGERRSIKEGILFGLSCLKMIKEDWDVVDVDHMPFFPVIFMKVACLLKRKKMIATWHEVWGLTYWKKYLGWKGYIAYFIEKICVQLPNTIISISDTTTNRLRKEFGIKQTIYTVPIGIDYEMIHKVKPAEEKSDIIFAGRLLKHKNVDVLLHAIRIIKQKNHSIKAIIVGNGPEKKELQNLSEKLELHDIVLFKNFFYSEKEMFSYIKSSQVFVLPSSREGLGLIALEANACGTPVITVNEEHNVSKDFVSNFGTVTDLNDHSLADEILKIIDEKKRPAIDRQYSWRTILFQLENIYKL